MFNNNKIAQITSKKRIYTISDLEGIPLLNVQAINIELTATTTTLYYNISLPDGSKSKNIRNIYDKNAFTPEKKLLLDFAYGSYKLLTPTGLNQSAITSMFESDQSELDELLEYRLQYRKNVETHIKIFQDSKLIFDDSTTNTFGYKKGFDEYIILGYIQRKIDNAQKKYTIKDKKSNVIATWNAKEDNMLRIEGSSDLEYIHHSNTTTDDKELDDDNLVKAMLGYLIEKSKVRIPKHI
ncbi:hypothetical protein LNQ81_06180 [Myroides sp. M-43]|uniref:hypothetical protein n=1 Tax=Myroides oncorhynchi TaxID=2893756 RepID=UPI001E32F694|nr:hypothetical protein [Myroides oncorhynchi]MCC9042278.1 hypothetical protein [Myroides oncorhynchi]